GGAVPTEVGDPGDDGEGGGPDPEAGGGGDGIGRARRVAGQPDAVQPEVVDEGHDVVDPVRQSAARSGRAAAEARAVEGHHPDPGGAEGSPELGHVEAAARAAVAVDDGG